MKEKKTVWFLPFRYPAPADLEHYLEGMDKEGWHIEKISQTNSMAMRFTRSAPQKNRYVVDLNATFRTKDYVATYESFGWELVGKMASMFVWRMPYQDKRPEAFTDAASVLERSHNISRVMLLLSVLLIAMLGVLTILFFAAKGYDQPDGSTGFLIAVVVLGALIAVLFLARHAVVRNQNR